MDNWAIKDIPEEIFSVNLVDEFNRLMEKYDVTFDAMGGTVNGNDADIASAVFLQKSLDFGYNSVTFIDFCSKI